MVRTNSDAQQVVELVRCMESGHRCIAEQSIKIAVARERIIELEAQVQRLRAVVVADYDKDRIQEAVDDWRRAAEKAVYVFEKVRFIARADALAALQPGDLVANDG